jgi:CubicO group peptidase (beta-lactamase class C family)
MVNNHSMTKTRSGWSMTALNKSTFALSVCLLAALSFSAPQSMAKQNQNKEPAKEKIKNSNKGAKQGDKRLTESLLDTFEATVEAARDFYDIPGVAIAIVEGNDIAYAEGFGVRNIKTEEPVTPNTRFYLNSVTKSMTATMLAKLVDKGLLEWKQPVVDIMPSFTLPTEELTQNVQVRDLIEMNTGLGGDPVTYYYNHFVSDGFSAQDLFDLLVTLPVVGEAGDDIFDYSSELFAVAGFIAALVSDTSYENLMQEHIFGPIGMESAIFTTDFPAVGGDYASSHAFNFATGQVESFSYPPVNFSGYAPAEGLSTNVLDIARYLIMQLNKGIASDGSRVISVKNLMKTRQPKLDVTDDPTASRAYSLAQSLHYGMGWMVAEQVNGVKMLVQSGKARGFVSDMSFIQDADVGLVILINRQTSSIIPSATSFLATVRASFYGLIYSDEPTTAKKVADKVADIAHQYEQSLETTARIRTTITEDKFTFDTVEDYLGNYEKGWYVEWRDEETKNEDGEREGTLWMGTEVMEYPGVMEYRLEYQLVLLPGDLYLFSNHGSLGTNIRFSRDDGTVTIRFPNKLKTYVKVD